MIFHLMYDNKTGFHSIEKEFPTFADAEKWLEDVEKATYWEIGIKDSDKGWIEMKGGKANECRQLGNMP